MRVVLSVRLACRDWLHEFGLSCCGVLALASMLAPLLVLHGIHLGVVERMRQSLMRDPTVLVCIPVGGRGAGFEERFIEDINAQKFTRFAIGRTRDVASELQVRKGRGERITITLEATAKGDPVLERHGLQQPQSRNGHLEMVLSSNAARRLACTVGDTVCSDIGRRQVNGKLQTLPLEFLITGVLPPEAMRMETGFIDMNTLTAIQDFRDGVSNPLLNFHGELPPATERHFESFRAYATSLDTVETLDAWFREQGVPVKTQSSKIANIRNIDSTLTSVIMLIALTVCVGFMAFMASTAQAAVRRKWKLMGILRLIGFNRFSLLLYPVVQSLLTGCFGCLLAFVLYYLGASAIDIFFTEQTGGESICMVSLRSICTVFVCVQILAMLSSLQAAYRAASIEPSAVINEI